MKKKLLILFVIFLSIVAITYLYIFHKPHRDYHSEPAAFSLLAPDLLLEFQSNETRCNEKYNNKMIEITGVITDVTKERNGFTSLAIDYSVFCSFEISLEKKAGEKIKIKGRCTGYDELFSQVTLEKCIIVE